MKKLLLMPLLILTLVLSGCYRCDDEDDGPFWCDDDDIVTSGDGDGDGGSDDSGGDGDADDGSDDSGGDGDADGGGDGDGDGDGDGSCSGTDYCNSDCAEYDMVLCTS